MQKQRVAMAAVVLLSLGIFLGPLVSGGPSYVWVSGRVYKELGPRGTPVNPVSAATVSNDWDSTTAMTNARGEFRLRVRRVAADEWIKIVARAGDTAACQRRLGPVERHTVDIVLDNVAAGC